MVVNDVLQFFSIHTSTHYSINATDLTVAEALDMIKNIALPAMTTALPVEEVGTLMRIGIVV